MLAAAREATGLAIVTEVMAPEHVPLVAKYADVLQIGARNMQNYQLLQAVGDCGKPALLKRGMSATIDEFLLAAEYILDRGNPNVILCERGIRTYEEHTRFTLPLATVPYLHDKSHLPVVVDPSHGTGKARLVAPMAKAAIACGADGLIVEVHDDPEHAMSDGSQTITPAAFAQMMAECRRMAEAVDRTMWIRPDAAGPPRPATSRLQQSRIEPMTKLSVNVNKVATLRNTRHSGIPSVVRAAKLCLDAGATGSPCIPGPTRGTSGPDDVRDLAESAQGLSRARVQHRGQPVRGRLPRPRPRSPADAMHARARRPRGVHQQPGLGRPSRTPIGSAP